MTSFKQIEANRRNALKSTGPVTEQGRLRSRRNAVRHGLTAETVINALEDADDYKVFEAAVIASYDAESAVERELALRLASLLWRLRRATIMETGLFDIQARHVLAFRLKQQLHASGNILHGNFNPNAPGSEHDQRSDPQVSREETEQANSTTDLAHCYLRLANLPNYALDRLSRYEAALWRQVAQIIFTLNVLDRRKPWERRRPALRNLPETPFEDS